MDDLVGYSLWGFGMQWTSVCCRSSRVKRFLTYATPAAKLSGDMEENNYYLVSYEG